MKVSSSRWRILFPPSDAKQFMNFKITMTSDSLLVMQPSAMYSRDSSSAIAATSSGSCALKRKRPPKIEIPTILREIQTDKVSFTPQNDALSINGAGFGVSSIKGKKKFMEDAHKIVSFSHGNSKKGFFGVFDGHGGKKAAEFVAENLHTNILQMLETCMGNSAKEEAIKAGYLKTDQDFLNQGLGSGACCVTALIEEKDIVVSNLGDCRAVLCRGGKAEALTKDHRAEQEDERKRIENKGGYVEMHRGAWRVHGILAVSRSIGDAHLKDWVLAEPDTKILHLTPDMEFLVLASDGLWEEVGNQEAVDTVTRFLLTDKKLGPAGDLRKENNNDEYGCVSTSPSSKLRRVSLVKQQKKTSQSPSYKKTIDSWNKSEENDYACENESPPSKARRISLVKRQNIKTLSPSFNMTVENWKENEEDNYACKNESPSSNARRISFVKRQDIKTPSPNFKTAVENWMENEEGDYACKNESPSNVRRISFVKWQNIKTQSPSIKKTVESWKENEDDYACENESPPSKAQRISLFMQQNMKTRSPNYKKTLDSVKEKEEDDYACENESPPSKAQRISLFKRENTRTQSPSQEDNGFTKIHASGGLVGACKELVNLAVSRGSLDDITVMIIDLNHFRRNS